MSKNRKNPRERGHWMAGRDVPRVKVVVVEVDDIAAGDFTTARQRLQDLGLPPGAVGEIAMEDGSSRFVQPLLLPFKHEECTVVLDHTPPSDVFIEDGSNKVIATLHGTDCEMSTQLHSMLVGKVTRNQIPDYCSRRLAGGFFPWVTRDELGFDPDESML